jgi:hypothetical protein
MNNDPNQPPQQPQQNPYDVPPTQYPVPPSPYEMPPTQYAAPPYNQPAYGAPPYNPPGAAPYNPAPYGAPPVPGYAQAPQQPKKSLRWLWITLSIVGGVLVLGCAGCITLSVLGYNILAPTVTASVTASSYYQAIQNQDYTKAYSYLASNMQTTGGVPLTQSVFTTAATTEDTSLGPVTSVAQTGISTSNGTASVTMSVTRNGQSYVVHLQLQQINGNWVITQFDRI